MAKSKKPVAEDKISSVSRSRTLDEMAEFWETHSLTNFDDQTPEVEMTFDASARFSLVNVEPKLMARLRRIARQRGVSVQTLVNIWLRQCADQATEDSRATG